MLILVSGGETAADAPRARMGGVPLAPEGFTWPVCRQCGGPMRFIAHLPLAEAVFSVFSCENDPGACENWYPWEGANRVHVFPPAATLAPVEVPAEGETLLETALAIRVADREEYYGAAADPPVAARRELGGVHALPEWFAADRVPVCPGCAAPMPHVADLRGGPRDGPSPNFGGGEAYVFHCAPCGEAAVLNEG
ncbi:hypothetical protein ABZ853_28115 [Streptomyces albidoflavus]